MIHNYPYTDFHELNLDYILKLAREMMGLHLVVIGDDLKLVNQAGEDISKVKIHYADTALKDVSGNDIRAYILNAGLNGDTVILTRGDGEYITLTIPYAVKAEKDVNNTDITSYIHGLGVSGNKLLITYGNGNTYSFTVPFATKAGSDENGKSITTYVAELSTGNNKLIVTDGEGTILSEITIPYAEKALNDIDDDPIKATYGTTLSVDTTTVSLRNKNSGILSTITVPYSVKSMQDDTGSVFRSDYGYHLNVNNNKIGIESHNGTTLNEITVPFASLSTHATNSIETVSISGDEITFTTYGGTVTRITSPYAVKALKDSLNNTIVSSYVSRVTNDAVTGKISFYAQDGSLLAEMTPTLDSAIHDSYQNTIADYVKTIITNPNNDYMTVTHGTGTSETITIHYATRAWKDTYDNVIGNTYIRSLNIVTDSLTGHKMLVAYNGELSELFRLDLTVNSASEIPVVLFELYNFNDTTLRSVHLLGSTDELTYTDIKNLLYTSKMYLYFTQEGVKVELSRIIEFTTHITLLASEIWTNIYDPGRLIYIAITNTDHREVSNKLRDYNLELESDIDRGTVIDFSLKANSENVLYTERITALKHSPCLVNITYSYAPGTTINIYGNVVNVSDANNGTIIITAIVNDADKLYNYYITLTNVNTNSVTVDSIIANHF